MKVLSVGHPWAWAIVRGIKMVGNRWRRTNYCGPTVIHASRSRRYLEEDFADPARPGAPMLTHPGVRVSELAVSLPDADVLIGLNVLLDGRLLLDGPARQFTLEL